MRYQAQPGRRSRSADFVRRTKLRKFARLLRLGSFEDAFPPGNDPDQPGPRVADDQAPSAHPHRPSPSRFASPTASPRRWYALIPAFGLGPNPCKKQRETKNVDHSTHHRKQREIEFNGRFYRVGSGNARARGRRAAGRQSDCRRGLGRERGKDDARNRFARDWRECGC